MILKTDDRERTRPAHVVLKQEGTKLTGSVGPRADERYGVQSGTAANGVLTFEAPVGGTVMKFKVKQDGDEIKGAIPRERENGTGTVAIALKREK